MLICKSEYSLFTGDNKLTQCSLCRKSSKNSTTKLSWFSDSKY